MSAKKRVSVICPVFNEENNVAPFFSRILRVFKKLDPARYDWQLLFTINGSTDRTYDEVSKFCREHSSVQLITLSRNFGYQCSIFAGLEHATGDYFMIIDVDCEDPPEMLLDFLDFGEQGFDIVYGIRDKRDEFILMHWARKVF